MLIFLELKWVKFVSGNINLLETFISPNKDLQIFFFLNPGFLPRPVDIFTLVMPRLLSSIIITKSHSRGSL